MSLLRQALVPLLPSHMEGGWSKDWLVSTSKKITKIPSPMEKGVPKRPAPAVEGRKAEQKQERGPRTRPPRRVQDRI